MYRRLRANQDGIVSATQAAQLVAPVEGEALITAGGASIREAARAAELDETVMARGGMQTVRPDECPPCPGPSVIYRDRVVEKPVYIYRTAPGAGGSPGSTLPVEHLPMPDPGAAAAGGGSPDLPAAGDTPEQGPPRADAAAGLPVVRKDKGWPWWLAVVGGVLWLAMRKR